MQTRNKTNKNPLNHPRKNIQKKVKTKSKPEPKPTPVRLLAFSTLYMAIIDSESVSNEIIANKLRCNPKTLKSHFCNYRITITEVKSLKKLSAHTLKEKMRDAFDQPLSEHSVKLIKELLTSNTSLPSSKDISDDNEEKTPQTICSGSLKSVEQSNDAAMKSSDENKVLIHRMLPPLFIPNEKTDHYAHPLSVKIDDTMDMNEYADCQSSDFAPSAARQLFAIKKNNSKLISDSYDFSCWPDQSPPATPLVVTCGESDFCDVPLPLSDLANTNKALEMFGLFAAKTYAAHQPSQEANHNYQLANKKGK